MTFTLSSNSNTFLSLNKLSVNTKGVSSVTSLFLFRNSLQFQLLIKRLKFMTISINNIFSFQYLKNLVSDIKDLKGKNLAPAIQLSYIILCDHNSKFDEFTITIKELCNMFHCEERQVFRHLKKLENSGLIKRKCNTSNKEKRKVGNSLFITLIHPSEIFKHNDMESI